MNASEGLPTRQLDAVDWTHPLNVAADVGVSATWLADRGQSTVHFPFKWNLKQGTIPSTLGAESLFVTNFRYALFAATLACGSHDVLTIDLSPPVGSVFGRLGCCCSCPVRSCLRPAKTAAGMDCL